MPPMCQRQAEGVAAREDGARQVTPEYESNGWDGREGLLSDAYPRIVSILQQASPCHWSEIRPSRAGQARIRLPKRLPVEQPEQPRRCLVTHRMHTGSCSLCRYARKRKAQRKATS